MPVNRAVCISLTPTLAGPETVLINNVSISGASQTGYIVNGGGTNLTANVTNSTFSGNGVAKTSGGSGDITYFASSRGLKRPLAVAFNRFGDQSLHGLTSLQFHAMPTDPAKGREALAYAVFRAAGVPAWLSARS